MDWLQIIYYSLDWLQIIYYSLVLAGAFAVGMHCGRKIRARAIAEKILKANGGDLKAAVQAGHKAGIF